MDSYLHDYKPVAYIHTNSRVTFILRLTQVTYVTSPKEGNTFKKQAIGVKTI